MHVFHTDAKDVEIESFCNRFINQLIRKAGEPNRPLQLHAASICALQAQEARQSDSQMTS